MRLSELEPRWGEEKNLDGSAIRAYLNFKCPACRGEKCGMVSVPFAGSSSCQWQLTGDDFNTLSLSPSIWVNKGGTCPGVCDVHFWVTNGDIIFS